MKPRIETYTLTRGAGRIEVRGNRFASGVFVDGKPFVFNFYDCAGSIGQELYRFGTRGNETFACLSDVTENPPPKSAGLSEFIHPLLSQFAPGVYTLTLAPLAEGEFFLEDFLLAIPEGAAFTRAGYYPEANGVYNGKRLVPTQSEEALDDSRIAHFWYAVEQGTRPFAVTASTDDSPCEFVLDGHHKLMAYAYAKIPPWRLCISRNAPPLAEGDWPEHIVTSPRSWGRLHTWQREHKP